MKIDPNKLTAKNIEMIWNELKKNQQSYDQIVAGMTPEQKMQMVIDSHELIRRLYRDTN